MPIGAADEDACRAAAIISMQNIEIALQPA
jgi:hypothetical protein